jgi:hypothetical protein
VKKPAIKWLQCIKIIIGLLRNKIKIRFFEKIGFLTGHPAEPRRLGASKKSDFFKKSDF